VTEANRSIVVFVGHARGGLSGSQRTDVMGLAQTWVREGTGAVIADVPIDTPNARAAAASFREIQSVLMAGGVPSRAITLRHYRPDDPRTLPTIRLSYPKITAVAGPCGLWPQDLGPNIDNVAYNENRSYHNFGCATQRNLAAMIDNPADLEQPRPESPAYTPRRDVAFEKYRKGTRQRPAIPNPTKPNSAIQANDQPRLSKLRRSTGRHAGAARGIHLAGATRIGAGLLRQRRGCNRGARASEDRRLGKAHLSVHMGGIAAAIETYHTAPTPNVIVLETEPGSDILEALDELATVCDAGTRVVVIGSANDVTPYRELVRRGVSDYVTGPVEPIDVVRAICGLYAASEAVAVGRIIAVVGAKGGVGASTVAHNVAWAIARDLALDSVVIDLDLAFGTASLDYNQDPVQGIANAVFQPERPDSAFMERLLSKCTDRLDLLAAPATLDQVYDFGADAFDAIFDTMRMTTPCIVLDVPHQWSAWTKRTLVGADDILIVAEPDLANMRNAKNMLNVLKAARPNDRPPLYCLNQVGMHKRPEISTREFAKAIESQPIAAIPFDSRMFGTAANNGQMIAQISAKHRTTKMFLQMAQRLTGHAVTKRSRTSFLAPILKKLQGATARRA
jgi:pilus assembly protein CpaE